ncbi:hypothetical protein BO70DRAFT_77541 [Aspergillus heteromorphus CBS 117.55]|uniref:Uncharacterized protein n=1 Tax=Aspergillus heteromorphus CBS 117.55 TaxID=1448321 RepID=A0A317WXL1_9EURO|nr:uncharacterized protein BO70DRAFT_77541 [Aspergillus heteromorphus CBS 117.55]PWY90755.1 hypothetical protein BO70DRAFT_77541 [Aspergillus heteromorphus CBS 117.55]
MVQRHVENPMVYWLIDLPALSAYVVAFWRCFHRCSPGYICRYSIWSGQYTTVVLRTQYPCSHVRGRDVLGGAGMVSGVQSSIIMASPPPPPPLILLIYGVRSTEYRR